MIDRVKFKFEGAEHTAYLGEDNQWWREDGVHYRIDGEAPSQIIKQVFPLIRLRAGTLVRVKGYVTVEYDHDDIDQMYYERLGAFKDEENLIDGLAFVDFLERAKEATDDCAWVTSDEIFVYKPFPMTADAQKAARKAFFWQKRRQFIEADLAAIIWEH